MKLLLAALLILLTACAGLPFTDEARARGVLENVGQFYRTGAVIHTGGSEMRVRIERPDPALTRVHVLYPERVAGLTYTFREEGVQLELHGMTFNLDAFAVRGAPVPQMVSALSALLLPHAERGLPTEQGEYWLLRERENTLLLDAQGRPLKLSLSGGNVEITLTDFVFLG